MIQWALANKRIAIGWGAVGSLAQAQFTAPGNIRETARGIAHQSADAGSRAFLRRPLLGVNLWNFRGGSQPFHANAQGGPHPHRLAMQFGDLIILKTDIGPLHGFQESVVMRVTGPYEWVPLNHLKERFDHQQERCLEVYGYQHQRDAEQVTCINAMDLWDAAGGPNGVIGLDQAVRGNALVLLQFQVECQSEQLRRVTDG